jgi:hypothetical protein
MIFENAKGIATGNARVLACVTGEDHTSVALHRQGKEPLHLFDANRAGLIEDEHTARA